MPTCVTHQKEIIDEQEREVERAVIRRGKYKFRKEFHSPEVTEGDWYRMSKDQREKHLKKVAQANMVMATSQDVGKSIADLPTQFPISPEEFHTGLKIPLASVWRIWQKASDRIIDSTAISPAPGYGPDCKW